MACKHCGGSGISKHTFKSPDGNNTVSISVCSYCKDYAAYYAYIKNRYSSKKSKNKSFVEEKDECQIIDFKELKKNN